MLTRSAETVIRTNFSDPKPTVFTLSEYCFTIFSIILLTQMVMRSEGCGNKFLCFPGHKLSEFDVGKKAERILSEGESKKDIVYGNKMMHPE